MKAKEAAARLEAECKIKEEAERLAAEHKAKEEATRLETERKIKEEAERLAAERRVREEIARLEAERKAEQLRIQTEKNSDPSLWCSIKIDDREVRSGKVLIANKEVGLPFGWSKLKKGEKIPTFEVEYTEDGKRYIGRFEKLTVDWLGERELTIFLFAEGNSVAR
jgi:hypothetical protein